MTAYKLYWDCRPIVNWTELYTKCVTKTNAWAWIIWYLTFGPDPFCLLVLPPNERGLFYLSVCLSVCKATQKFSWTDLVDFFWQGTVDYSFVVLWITVWLMLVFPGFLDPDTDLWIRALSDRLYSRYSLLCHADIQRLVVCQTVSSCHSL